MFDAIGKEVALRILEGRLLLYRTSARAAQWLWTAAGEPGPPLVGSVRDVEPLRVERVREPAERLLFRELVGRQTGVRVMWATKRRGLRLCARDCCLFSCTVLTSML